MIASLTVGAATVAAGGGGGVLLAPEPLRVIDCEPLEPFGVRLLSDALSANVNVAVSPDGLAEGA